MNTNNAGFRSWYYFRMGWSTYFTFAFAAINTLTVTYYLAIERIPSLQAVFPTFAQYVVIATSIGIPLLIISGWIHFKKIKARKAEVDIATETNPYQVRTLVNTELVFKQNLKLISLLLKLTNNEKPTKEEIDEINQLQSELLKFDKQRSFAKDMDLEFFKNMRKAWLE